MNTYLVGGAVRDRLLGQDPKDRDWVVVGISPSEMLAAGFEQVGASFPVFLHPETQEEYALARTEVKDGVGYHGFKVNFDPSITIEQDLERRDLTINSIAFDPLTNTYVDPFNGRKDLKEHLLRHTSAAFADDPLRVIRLCRFAARFETFNIHHATWALAQRLVQNGELNHLPHERFAAEIAKTFQTCSPKGVERFFSLLADLEVDTHVGFFKGARMKWLVKLARTCTCIGGDRAVLLFAGLSNASRQFIVAVGGAEGLRLHDVISDVRDDWPAAERAERVHDWLRKAGTFQKGNTFINLVEIALMIGHMAGEWHVITSREATAAAALTAPVAERLVPLLTAQGVEGKAIGDALREDRVRLLRSLFPS